MKYRKIIITALLVFVFAGMTAITVAAQPDKRAANIKSRGVFDYQHGTALIDASDLTYLANEIDLLEDTYKKETVDALNQVGTYFKSDGTTTIDPAEGTLQAEDANVLEYRTIKEALINSQAIPALPFSGERPGETDPVSGTITGATAENISLGAAAWVDGKLIIGNGGDNISYYNKGYTDGYSKTMQNVTVQYIYHVHTDTLENQYSDGTILTQFSNPGGCFKAYGHVHNEQCETISQTYPCNNNGQYWDGNRCRSCGGIGAGSGSCGGKIYKTSYTCGSPVNTWILGCNKSTNSIEKAELIFQ